MATGFESVETVTGQLLEIRPGRRISVAVAEGTAGADLTLFLCHGSGGNKDQWRFQWKTLTAAGHRVVAWDNVGHGASPQPRRRAAYAGSELAADSRAVFERFATGRNVLAGHSYGTRQMLALLLDLVEERQLHRVSSAVLFAPPPPDSPLAAGPFTWLPPFILELMRPRLSRHFRELAWHPATGKALIDYEEALTRRNSLFMMQALQTQAIRIDESKLSTLDLPVTILSGAEDRLTPPVFARALAEKLPRAELWLIETCGHQIMLERPDEALAALQP